jgi:hypothetical protein
LLILPGTAHASIGVNGCIGCAALSGPSVAFNFLPARLGPTSIGFLGLSNASQFGNNFALVGQGSFSHSGPALAGSQVHGLLF